MPIAQMGGLAARAAQNFDYYAGVITELHGRSFQVGDEFINYTVRKPAGVAGLIMPWNAPLMLSTWRIAPALAAGNTVVLKPAEWSPLTATLLAEVLEEAELPPGVFNVVHGFGETAGAPLSAHPGVDLICFTGETRPAALIAGRARRRSSAPRWSSAASRRSSSSRTPTPSSRSTPRSRRSSRMNGQRCTAGSRLLVQRPLYERIVEASPRARATSASATRSIRAPSSAR